MLQLRTMANFEKYKKNDLGEFYEDEFDEGLFDDFEENGLDEGEYPHDGIDTLDNIENLHTEEGAPETVDESADGDAVQRASSEEGDFLNSRSAGDKAQWYVVHTYSGHENKVKVNIEKIVENRGMQDLIQNIVVPTEDVIEIKNGQRKVRTRKMFPGYVIIKMIVTSESWYLVRNTQGVTGFVGHGSEPVPLSNEEVRHMGIEQILYSVDMQIGDAVKVIEGPFDNFMGTIEDINMEKHTIKVRISMFGRETPVELEFGQVEKIL